MSNHIHPHETLPRYAKEMLLHQKGAVLWFCGLSGSGKSTVAAALEHVLHEEGRFVVRLDGDNLRTGLNRDLGFSDEERMENIRRTAEVSKLLAGNGVIVLCSLITPKGMLRDLARGILGRDFFEIHVKASYRACAERDPKGLYAKAENGEIKAFPGLDAEFEPPQEPDLVIDTERLSLEDATFEVREFLTKKGITGKR
jgi:adenylyl-sulfate kinase